MYDLIRPALFSLDTECAHNLTIAGLARSAPVMRHMHGRHVPECPVRIMGLDLPNPVGLAAGLDKNGAAIDGMAGLGFGFVEIGTVTPRSQPGNPKPRLFRLEKERAIINRMGFNNDGVAALCQRVRERKSRGVLGINIGRNKTTSPEQAVDDYVAGLRAVHDLADYVAVNISSPNTEGLRDLQAGQALDDLLGRLVATRDELESSGCRVPLAVKIAPDLDDTGLSFVAERLKAHGIDAVIATNTTITRDGVPRRWQKEAGGLSGRPLADKSTAIIRQLATELGGALPIIGVGGIDSGQTAVDKIHAGATAVQIYSGLIYRGPALIKECVEAIRNHQADAGSSV